MIRPVIRMGIVKSLAHMSYYEEIESCGAIPRSFGGRVLCLIAPKHIRAGPCRTYEVVLRACQNLLFAMPSTMNPNTKRPMTKATAIASGGELSIAVAKMNIHAFLGLGDQSARDGASSYRSRHFGS